MNDAEMKERKREKPTLVVAALIENDGKYFLIRETKFRFWRPPGGRVNRDEKIEDALHREMKEEIGIDVKIIKTLGFGEDHAFHEINKYRGHRVIIYFLCKADTEISHYSDETGETIGSRWASMEELKSMEDLEPALKDMIQRFNL
jgi:8-oxo-dGTP diphosphatase